MASRQPRTAAPTAGGWSASPEASDELAAKLAVVRDALERNRLAGLRLRGHDWFAWATCGGSNAVLLASEVGAAEMLVTVDGAWIVTDAIEAGRMRAEEAPADLPVIEFDWAKPAEREAFVRESVAGGAVASDRPMDVERPLPTELVIERRRLAPAEVERYRILGRDTAIAVTEALGAARPELTELEVAGIAARSLLARDIEPALVLVAGAERISRYRHPRPTRAQIGERAELIVCGRRAGLYANLTRYTYFRSPTPEERADTEAVALVEAAAWDASGPGATLGAVYSAIVRTYADLGHAGAERDHHQGGITGYLSREVLATPGGPVEIERGSALAWNPSLPGAKIEDTVLCTSEALEILTVDPDWPVVEVAGRPRPRLQVRD